MTPKSWRNFALEHLDRLLIFNTFILINWFWHWYWLFDVETWSINSEYWQRKAFSLLQRLLTCHNSSPQQLSWGNLLPLLRKPDQNIFLFVFVFDLIYVDYLQYHISRPRLKGKISFFQLPLIIIRCIHGFSFWVAFCLTTNKGNVCPDWAKYATKKEEKSQVIEFFCTISKLLLFSEASSIFVSFPH